MPLCLARFVAAALFVTGPMLGVAAAGAERAPTAAEDRRDHARYQLQLAELMATLGREDARQLGGSKAPATSSVSRGGGAGCEFFQPGAKTASAESCRSCHGMHSSHPVDIDYSVAEYRSRDSLRPAAEAVRRGIFLPEGKVRCASCHEPLSKWKYHLALPPGSELRPAVDPHAPETYETRRKLSGNDVSPTPLCKACHTQGD